MKIAVIMSGIIKEYKHLENLNLIFGNNTKHDFKIFRTFLIF